MHKLQYYALRIFLVAMFACAFLVLFMIWSAPQVDPDDIILIPKLAATFFITGLASFLIWFVVIILEIKNKLGN